MYLEHDGIYHIDQKTARELETIAIQRNTTLKALIKLILHKLYSSPYRSMYVGFCESYSIFRREGYSMNYREEIYEDLTDIAGILAFKNDGEPEVLTGIIDLTF